MSNKETTKRLLKDGKCIIEGCTNKESQGTFIGNLCAPCYEFIVFGEGVYSQAYRNHKSGCCSLCNKNKGDDK